MRPFRTTGAVRPQSLDRTWIGPLIEDRIHEGSYDRQDRPDHATRWTYK